MDIKEKLSLLWIFVLFNMIFADIMGFMNPGDLEKIIQGDVGITLNQPILLLISVIQVVPIFMVVLSRILDYPLNRWINIAAAVLTILYITLGGDAILSYLFFASIEVLSMLYIIWLAWKWPALSKS